MTAQRPGNRNTNAAKRLLDRLDFTDTTYTTDIAAAQAFALIGLAEALGDIALSLRSTPTTTAAPTAETGA